MSKLELVGQTEPKFMIDQVATGRQMRAARLAIGECGLSLRAVATKMKISPAYLLDLELGRRAWNQGLVDRFNVALGNATEGGSI